jgi:hypothetical protein
MGQAPKAGLMLSMGAADLCMRPVVGGVMLSAVAFPAERRISRTEIPHRLD